MKTPETPAGATPAPVARAAGIAALTAALCWSCSGEAPYAPDDEPDHAATATGAHGVPARANLRGLVDLAPGLTLAPGGEARPDAQAADYASLFVLGRRDPDAELPELVARLPVGDTPLRFAASARDLVGFGTLTGDWWLELRLDHDGDLAASRGDVVGSAGPVRAGDDLVIVLDTVLAEGTPSPFADHDHAAHAAPSESSPAAEPTAAAGAALAHTQAVGAPARMPGPRMTGTLDIAPEFAGLAGQGTLFVFLKQGPTRRGMPWASIRFERPAFPLAIDIGPEHVTLEVENKADMLAGELWFMARLDMDGNAMTRGPDDIENEPVKVAGDGDAFSTVLDRRSDG